MTEKCGIRDHPSNIPYTVSIQISNDCAQNNMYFVFKGCIYKFLDELRDHLNIVAAVGSGICVVQIFGLILALILYVKLKDVDK